VQAVATARAAVAAAAAKAVPIEGSSPAPAPAVSPGRSKFATEIDQLFADLENELGFRL